MAAFNLNCIPDGKTEWGTSFGPWAVLTNLEGERVLNPELQHINAKIIEYWKVRAVTESHPILKARYADLVWDLSQVVCGVAPGIQFAEIAVEQYLKAAALAKSSEDSQEAIFWLERALVVALRIRRQNLIDATVREFFETYKRVMVAHEGGTWPFLFDNLYDRRGINLNASDLQFIISSLEGILTATTDLSNSKEFNPWAAKEASQRLARYYKKINSISDFGRVIRVAGGAFEEFSKQASPMVSAGWLEDIFHTYKDAGLTEDATRVRLAANQMAGRVHEDMKPLGTEISLSKETVEGFFKQLIAGDLETALTRMAIEFCPSADEAKASLQTLREKYHLQALIGEVIYQGGKFVAKVGSVEDDPEGRLIRQLSLSTDMMTPFLHEAFSRLKNSFDVSAEKICCFLFSSPLFDPERRMIFEQGLEDYFSGRYIQCISVLVPQIEDVIRRLLAHFGEPTNTPGGARTGGAMVEKTLNSILENEVIIRELSDDARLYFLAFLADRRGHNVRNRVAHGLMSTENFTSYIAVRLIHITLLLALLVDTQPQ